MEKILLKLKYSSFPLISYSQQSWPLAGALCLRLRKAPVGNAPLVVARLGTDGGL